MDDQSTSGSGTADHRGRSRILVIAVAGLALVALVYAFAGSVRPTLRLGDLGPAFNVTTRAGLQIDSEGLRGSVVVVNFFASWCKPCQDEAADLEALWQEYRARGVVLLGITYQDREEDIAAFIEKYGLSFHVADDRSGIARRFGVTGVPETYAFDQQGTLIYKTLGAIEPVAIRAALDSALAN